jgi:ATP-binding cassette subfamily B (MDR/TAP) protein 1
MMKLCDRLVVMKEGRVVETGTFDELTRRRGVFAALASSGEWQA